MKRTPPAVKGRWSACAGSAVTACENGTGSVMTKSCEVASGTTISRSPGKAVLVSTLVNTNSILYLPGDRKSTRLNSSHSSISYAVFCLKKKKKQYIMISLTKKKKKRDTKQLQQHNN